MPSCRIISFTIAQIKGGPLADRRVRQALNHAVDMQGILDAVLLGNGKRINSWMPPNVWGYDPSIPFYEYNPKKAKELLAAAGQTNLTADPPGAERALGHGQGHRPGGGRASSPRTASRPT